MARYSVLLVSSGLRKVDLARALGVHANTCYGWTDESVPGYVVAWLGLYVELARLKAVVGASA